MSEEAKNTTVYFLNKKMYINLTNLCTNECVFCIRDLNETVAGADLLLKKDVFLDEVIEDIKKAEPEKNADEIIFCGYGEPLIEVDLVLEIARFIKENYLDLPVRINTNGQANLIHKRNIIPELSKVIDRISISLNAENKELYDQICKPSFENAYEEVKSFISECVKVGIDTTVTIVTGFQDYKVDTEQCRQITENLGAKFRIREWLSEGYS